MDQHAVPGLQLPAHDQRDVPAQVVGFPGLYGRCWVARYKRRYGRCGCCGAADAQGNMPLGCAADDDRRQLRHLLLGPEGAEGARCGIGNGHASRLRKRPAAWHFPHAQRACPHPRGNGRVVRGAHHSLPCGSNLQQHPGGTSLACIIPFLHRYREPDFWHRQASTERHGTCCTLSL